MKKTCAFIKALNGGGGGNRIRVQKWNPYTSTIIFFSQILDGKDKEKTKSFFHHNRLIKQIFLQSAEKLARLSKLRPFCIPQLKIQRDGARDIVRPQFSTRQKSKLMKVLRKQQLCQQIVLQY